MVEFTSVASLTCDHKECEESLTSTWNVWELGERWRLVVNIKLSFTTYVLSWFCLCLLYFPLLSWSKNCSYSPLLPPRTDFSIKQVPGKYLFMEPVKETVAWGVIHWSWRQGFGFIQGQVANDSAMTPHLGSLLDVCSALHLNEMK